MNHIRYHGVLLWNEVTVDWLILSKWFGTFSALDWRMRARGLLSSLFVAQTTWFGIPDVCNAKGEWAEHGIKNHEVHNGNNI